MPAHRNALRVFELCFQIVPVASIDEIACRFVQKSDVTVQKAAFSIEATGTKAGKHAIGLCVSMCWHRVSGP